MGITKKKSFYVISTVHVEKCLIWGHNNSVFINKCSLVTIKFNIANSFYLLGGHRNQLKSTVTPCRYYTCVMIILHIRYHDFIIQVFYMSIFSPWC